MIDRSLILHLVPQGGSSLLIHTIVRISLLGPEPLFVGMESKYHEIKLKVTPIVASIMAIPALLETRRSQRVRRKQGCRYYRIHAMSSEQEVDRG